jgi:hypothetical protein
VTPGTLLSVILTAWSLGPQSTGIWYGLGISADGSRAVPGFTAAAGPCIPRGSVVEIVEHQVAPVLPRVGRVTRWWITDTGSALREAWRKDRTCLVDMLVAGDGKLAHEFAMAYGRRMAVLRVVHVGGR